MANSAKLTLPLVSASQAQKHVTVNETFQRLDVLVQLTILDRDLTAPPSSPAEGDTYIPASTATGAWVGQENNIATFQNGVWVFITPAVGWIAWVVDENTEYAFHTSQWNEITGVSTFTGLSDTPSSYATHQNKLVQVNSNGSGLVFTQGSTLFLPASGGEITGDLTIDKTNPKIQFQVDAPNRIMEILGQAEELKVLVDPTNVGANSAFEVQIDGTREAYVNQHGLGVGGAAADANNALSVTGAGALLSNGSGSVRVNLSKNVDASDTTIVFQSNFSTRFSFGLEGDNNFRLKRSTDGSAFVTAMYVSNANGRIGIGTEAPVDRMHIANFGDEKTRCLISNDQTNANGQSQLRMDTNASELFIIGNGSGSTPSRWGLTNVSGWNEILTLSGNGIAIGTLAADPIYFGTNQALRMVIASGGNVGIGTNAPSEALHVVGSGALFNNGSGSAELKVSKNATANDASVVLQTNFSTRGILGTTGNDDTTLKVSPDGSAFHDAFTVNRNSGRVTFPNTTIQNGPTPWTVVERNHITGSPWTLHDAAPDSSQWKAVAWSHRLSLFAAVSGTGTGNRVMTSPDGITWTNRSSAADNDWQDIVWAEELGLFVACSLTGISNRIMTSPDGITWTIRNSSGVNEGWRSIDWSPQLRLFVVVADTGSPIRVLTSPDGINWTARNSPTTGDWQDVIWADSLGLFVAVGDAGTHRVMTSSNGINWVVRGAPSLECNSITWSHELGLLVAVGQTGTGTRVMTSPDGITWTLRASPADNNWQSVTWASEVGLFVAVASSGTNNRIMTSPDGFTWTTRTSPADVFWIDVIWSPDLGVFCAVGDFVGTKKVMTSVSGHTAPRKKQRSGAFHAQGLASSPTAPATLVFNGVHGDNTDDFNTTTGAFTAPLPGWYFFKMQLLVNNNNAAGTTFSVELRKNGSAFGSDNIVFSETTAANRYHSFSGSLITELAEGDVITAQLLQGGNIFTGDETYFQGFHIEGVQ